MGEGLGPSPEEMGVDEERRIEDPDEAEAMARAEKESRGMADEVRKLAKDKPKEGLLDKSGIRKRPTRESYGRWAGDIDEKARKEREQAQEDYRADRERNQ